MTDEEFRRDPRGGPAEAEIDDLAEFLRRHPKHDFAPARRAGDPVPGAPALAYLDLGSGPRTLLVPSGGMGFLPGELGYRGLRRLAASQRVICPDPVPTADPDELAATYDALLDDLGVGRVSLYGSSGAGFAAQVYLTRAWRRIDRLVLAGTMPAEAVRTTLLHRVLLRVLPQALLRAVARKRGDRLLEAEVPPGLRDEMERFSRLLRTMIDRHFSKSGLLTALELIRQFADEGGLSGWDGSAWTGRALVITGEADPGFEHTETLRRALPACDLHVFGPEVGHLPALLVEDEYYDTIDRFLAA